HARGAEQVVFGEDDGVTVLLHDSRLDQLEAIAFVGGANDRRDAFAAADRAFEHDETFLGIKSARIGSGRLAIKYLLLRKRQIRGFAGCGQSRRFHQRIENRIAQGGEEGAAGIEDFETIGFEWSGRVGFASAVAVFIDVAAGLSGGLKTVPFQKERVSLREAVSAG